jgi:hypothetical protein
MPACLQLHELCIEFAEHRIHQEFKVRHDSTTSAVPCTINKIRQSINLFSSKQSLYTPSSSSATRLYNSLELMFCEQEVPYISNGLDANNIVVQAINKSCRIEGAYSEGTQIQRVWERSERKYKGQRNERSGKLEVEEC